MNAIKTQRIEKEEIKSLSFPKNEVLVSKEDQADRSVKLNRALSLGNLEQVKVKIVFEDNINTKSVETTIWGLTTKGVILKESTVIPLNRIVSVN
jgi:3-polyprenyl-4-hydroxybenzoate decarboxylase